MSHYDEPSGRGPDGAGAWALVELLALALAAWAALGVLVWVVIRLL
jgi:hypothetical protein